MESDEIANWRCVCGQTANMYHSRNDTCLARNKIEALESQLEALKADNAKIRVAYEGLERENEKMKAELETLKSTTPRGLYADRDAWKAKATKLAGSLRAVCDYAILHRQECVHPTTDRCVCGALSVYGKAVDALDAYESEVR